MSSHFGLAPRRAEKFAEKGQKGVVVVDDDDGDDDDDDVDDDAFKALSIQDYEKDASDVHEDGLESEISIENATVLEARVQTLTRLTPSPLPSRRRSRLSPMRGTFRSSSMPSEGSTTLVEVLHPLHQSQTSSTAEGFSPYIEDSSSSQRWSESPARRLPFASPDPSLHLATPSVQSSALHEVLDRNAQWESLDLDLVEYGSDRVWSSSQRTAPISAHTSDRVSIDLSSPLHVPIQPTSSSRLLSSGRISASELLVAMNAFLSHATPSKRRRFAASTRMLFSTYDQEAVTENVSPAEQVSISVDPKLEPDVQKDTSCETLPSSASKNTTVASSNYPVLTESLVVDSNRKMKDCPKSSMTESLPSGAVARSADGHSETPRTDILDRLATNNEHLRDLIMSWKTAKGSSSAETPIPTPPPASKPRGSAAGRRAAGSPCPPIACVHSPSAQERPGVSRGKKSVSRRSNCSSHPESPVTNAPPVRQSRPSKARFGMAALNTEPLSGVPPRPPSPTPLSQVKGGVATRRSENKENVQPPATPKVPSLQKPKGLVPVSSPESERRRAVPKQLKIPRTSQPDAPTRSIIAAHEPRKPYRVDQGR
ncbi:uncharacterized protein PV09_07835 [Verruconis gallopava]|uniref:Uncharacterized protein n=1 Tax=Verruconis gallopava TaxID=253628 RepID=A0A0D1YIG5_9PEZI|nr:uncharacterized protein PV09_07835 [Verruconis gallopava]KIW00642.1 hypothetical protein PV09_07835 [Verruconis gallopava]